MKIGVIGFLKTDTGIYLAKRTRCIGVGTYNGYGGKAEGKETLEETMIRELYEETGGVCANNNDLQKVAEIHFQKEGEDFWLGHVYFIHAWNGEPASTEEMIEPEHFHFDAIPYDKMLAADAMWLPEIIAGREIMATICYDADLGKVQQCNIKDL